MRRVLVFLAYVLIGACAAAHSGVAEDGASRLQVTFFHPPVHGAIPCDDDTQPDIDGKYWCHLTRLGEAPRAPVQEPAPRSAAKKAVRAQRVVPPYAGLRMRDLANLRPGPAPLRAPSFWVDLVEPHALEDAPRMPLPVRRPPYLLWLAASCAAAAFLCLWWGWAEVRRVPASRA